MVSIVPPNNFHWTTFPFFYPCARCFCFPRSNVAATTDRTVIFLQYSILTAHSHKRRVKSKRKRPASLQWHFKGNYTGCFFVCIQSPVFSVGYRDDKLRSYYWIDRKSLCCVLPLPPPPDTRVLMVGRDWPVSDLFAIVQLLVGLKFWNQSISMLNTAISRWKAIK